MDDLLQNKLVASSAHSGMRLESAVLCVDLDGTLLRTDTLHECLFTALKTRPTTLLWLPLWLAQGRYRLKQALTQQISGGIDLMGCPRNPEVERLIAEVKANGKKVELITAADQALITSDSRFCAMFDTIIGSCEGINLKAEAKAELLRKRHPDGFAYVGNSAADLPVWRVAKERFAVNVSPSVRRRAASEGLDLVELGGADRLAPALLKSLRLHHWLKNLLVFVPLGLIVSRAGLADILSFVTGFLLFGLLTSGTYLVNDILDVEADRQHPRKRMRPIASGDLSLPVAAMVGLALILSALCGAVLLNRTFALTLLSYLTLTFAYSVFLKRLPLVDVLVIGSLFTLRIVAGMTLIGESASEWLLIFAIFFFFSLALMKREVELNVANQTGVKALKGRGYAVEDRIFVVAFGIASGVASLVIFALFVSAMTEHPSASYATPELLWGVLSALSYWIMRMWLLTTRGLMNDDPILYAARERASLILAGVVVAFAFAAQLIQL